MIWVALAFFLALAGILVFPFWIRVRWVFRSGEARLELLPWGRSLGSGKLMSWLSRQVQRLMDRFLAKSPAKPSEDSKESSETPRDPKPKASKKPFPWRLGLWLAGRALALVGFLTRSLTFRVAGWDPAWMGLLQGGFGGWMAALGVRRVRWESDFRPSEPFVEMTWDLGGSVGGIGLWLGRNALRMPSRQAKADPPVGPAFSSLA